MNRLILLVFILINFLTLSKAQPTDTIKINLSEAEKLFVDSNLMLLAQKYDIDEKTALITQARIWDLPNLSFQQGAYQTEIKKWFVGASGTQGEASAQLQQLIVIAGKRNKQVAMAKENKEVSTGQFYDLLRTLKFQLRSDFYNLNFTYQTLNTYNLEIAMIGAVIDKYEKLYSEGLVSLKDVVRIKSLLLTLKSEQLDLQKNIAETQNELKVFLKLRTTKLVFPVGNFEVDTTFTEKLMLSTLIDTALICRPDLEAAMHQTKYSEFDLSYQKRLAIPDVELIAGWDHTGSYITNYNYAGIAIDLPLWNRNKGNIRAAQARLGSSKANYENLSLTITGDVEESYRKALDTYKVYRSFNHKFLREFSKLMDGANDSFSKHELSLMEFVDLYESFKDSQSQYNELLYNCLMSKEGINYAIGKEIVK